MGLVLDPLLPLAKNSPTHEARFRVFNSNCGAGGKTVRDRVNIRISDFPAADTLDSTDKESDSYKLKLFVLTSQPNDPRVRIKPRSMDLI